MQSRFVRALMMAAGLAVAGSSAVSAQEEVPDPQGVQLHSVLLGGNEVSNAGAANVGDQNGNGAAALIFLGEKLKILCIGTVVTDIDPPIAMHIHEDEAGENGPVVQGLTPPATGNPGNVSQCLNIGAALSKKIRERSNTFYINVHTGQFPDGAIRGQLH